MRTDEKRTAKSAMTTIDGETILAGAEYWHVTGDGYEMDISVDGYSELGPAVSVLDCIRSLSYSRDRKKRRWRFSRRDML